MSIKEKIREYWGKFQTAFLIPEVTSAFFAVGLTLVGLFQTQNAVSALVGIVWGIIAYAVFKGKTRWCLTIIILVLTGAFFYWINPFVVKFVMSGRDQISSQPHPLKAPPEPEYGLIKNGGFDQGYDGLNGWISNERPQRPSFVSDDVTGTLATTKEYVMSVKTEMGYWGAGLVINCKEKPKPNADFRLVQLMTGLKPNGKYKISFRLYIAEHIDFSGDSLYMAIGTPWQVNPENEWKVLKKSDFKSGWNDISRTLINPGGTDNKFFIVVNDVTKNLRLDDIRVELSE